MFKDTNRLKIKEQKNTYQAKTTIKETEWLYCQTNITTGNKIIA